MVSLRPSSVRIQILEHHRDLTRKLDHLQKAAVVLAAAGSASLDRALALGRELCKELSEHIELENQILVPALRETDAWGEIRAQELARQHWARRRDLAALPVDDPCAIEPHALAVQLVDLVAMVQADIANEDQSVLTPEVLRDDVYGIDVEGG